MLLERMIRAARLDPGLYYELERDRSANGQAFLVVLIVVACALIGSAALSLPAIFNAGLCTIGGWLFWSAIAMVIGMRFGGRADFEAVMRPVAFAYAPGVLRLFALFPGLGQPISLVVWIWVTIATVIAVREAMRFATGKAVLTVVLTTAIMAVINLLTGMTFGALACLPSGLGR